MQNNFCAKVLLRAKVSLYAKVTRSKLYSSKSKY